MLGHRCRRYIAACTGTLNLFGNLGTAILILYIVLQEIPSSEPA